MWEVKFYILLGNFTILFINFFIWCKLVCIQFFGSIIFHFVYMDITTM